MERTPREIVECLDQYIIGQESAKKAVAVALRNRYRRSRLPQELQDEIIPKNILMIGSTGIGKTEIARRLAKLAQAPFIKVEATKFTEVGYVGRDVDSIVRDLVEASVRMVKAEKMEEVKHQAAEAVEDRLVQLLVPMPAKHKTTNPFSSFFPQASEEQQESSESQWDEATERIRSRQEKIREKLRSGEFEDRHVEVEVEDKNPAMLDALNTGGLEDMGLQMQDLLGSLLPKRKKKRKMPIRHAREVLQQEEAAKMLDMDAVSSEAVWRTENSGIVFLDELDKVASRDETSGPDVSREGVQRDILPIVEGSTVVTKYGPVKTHHMLFIAAGAFHVAKPSDLIPELQGRFPIRVELSSLNQNDFCRILTEPTNALLKQYQALLGVEGLELHFTDDGIQAIAATAERANQDMENIGARRLHTILERVLEHVSFEADALGSKVVVDAAFVEERIGPIRDRGNLANYIL